MEQTVTKDLVISAGASELTIALLEDKQLVEITREKQSSRFCVGDIYLAKVKKVVSGLNAVFVELGYDKDAFLHYHDLGPQFSSLSKLLAQYLSLPAKASLPSFDQFTRIPDIDKNGNIADVIKTGQHILVQIAKEPISTKGPRLCSEISIAGRNLVLMPFSDKISISQKIESGDEKARLKRIIQGIKPANYGVIVRTVAVGRSAQELESEMRELVERWEKTLVKIRQTKSQSPKLVMSELDRVAALLRDIMNESFNSIIVDNQEVYEEIRDYIKAIAPEKEKIVQLYTGGQPIFEFHGIEKQIRSLFGKHVAIKNGAYVIIERTEALHVIDVNSGNRTKFEKDQESNALDVNIAAANEIARQLRLRDLGGIIVVDFIDMKSPENKMRLYEEFKKAMSADRAKHNVLPLSKFGLSQITRQRVRPEVDINTNEVCPTCSGTGEVSPTINLVDKLEDDVRHIRTVLRHKKIILRTHPILAGFLRQGLISRILKWRFKYGINIDLQVINSMGVIDYKFFDAKENEIVL